MSDREVPYDDNAVCDECGKRGAFDFMGDYLCSDCASENVGTKRIAWHDDFWRMRDED